MATNFQLSPEAAKFVPKSDTEWLREFWVDQSSVAVFSHCLGIRKIPGSPPFADNAIVICFDTEGWMADRSKITEIGMNTFDSRDMRGVDPGLYGENLLKRIYFYHIRIQPNAHLINIRFNEGRPDRNRFGQTRFLTIEETTACLTECFAWDIDAMNPKLGKCPVVIMGHALGNDIARLKDTIGFDAHALDTIVKVVDTQEMARETGHWPQIGHPASLEKLVGRLNFAHRDPHTACNDAAMTTVCAVQMCLPRYTGPAVAKSLQDVVNAVEQASRQQVWDWGSNKYCLRCGSREHMEQESSGTICFNKVSCEHCIETGRIWACRSHRSEGCISYALDQATLAHKPKVTYASRYHPFMDADPYLGGRNSEGNEGDGEEYVTF